MNNRSVPVAIVQDDPELAKVFRGMAVYNHGRVTVAYRMPMKFSIIMGIERLFMQPMVIAAGARLVLEMEPLSDGVIDVSALGGLIGGGS